MLRKLIPHICIILSLMMLTFFVVDKFNPGMNFVGNEVFKILLLIYGIATIISSAYLIYCNRRN
ncbi:MAG: hypothetical protein ACOX8Q_07925 [Christensenellales bacterium]|jgi:hypothetical protein